MEPEEQSKLAQATQAILKAKNLTVNSASGRLGIDRGVLTRMHDYGTPPRLDVLERFARGLRLDVNEWRVLAGYEPVLPAPDLSRLSFGQHDSPQNRYETTVNALYVKYTGLQWERVPHPQLERHFSGGEVKDDRQADQLLAAWLEELGKRNPGKPAPEELAEYEERLAVE